MLRLQVVLAVLDLHREVGQQLYMCSSACGQDLQSD